MCMGTSKTKSMHVRVEIIRTEINAGIYSTVPPSVSLKKNKTLEFILELEFQGYFIFSIKIGLACPVYFYILIM